ncbi:MULTISPECIES: glycosyltransferase [unclassified Mucilaginibacter]|uniref:glycosyltransferase n=1 Tax=unclassified Mucilaginibacter TaxID=2617802 RepID=UPI000A53D04B|nr:MULTISPECIES: glycosyltransferase [unclassified Mucilaginibacter]PLW91022.1 MAG: hypothetical protein C0154_03405 [Mucilaginibacter sp.]HEK20530.1 glycosyltransferase [Bacteroidota bacterium]
MKLSVIVVNYNMCTLLRQALYTLTRACKFIDYELIIIDDVSTDKSVKMLNEEFPDAKLIVNEQTLGIAASRNKGIEMAGGEYILLVNADIICGKKTIEQVVDFMDAHQDAGSVGVRALTPGGRFIPHSRTGFTKPWAALLKLTGLSKYFTKSRLYKNNNNWAEEDEFATTEVDVVNGAFMLLRKQALEQTGLLDEKLAYFGHDIDISFRLRLLGYKNYYYPRTYILSFNKQIKPTTSWNYIKHYYGAMFIFAAKYLFKKPELKLPGIPQLFAPKYEIER